MLCWYIFPNGRLDIYPYAKTFLERVCDLLCRMSKPGGSVRPSMMSLSVSGMVSKVKASSSTELVLTFLSTQCRRSALPIWSTVPPTKERNLNRMEVYVKKCMYILQHRVKTLTAMRDGETEKKLSKTNGKEWCGEMDLLKQIRKKENCKRCKEKNV